MKIIKSHTYNVVNTEPFEFPKPIKFELMYGNGLLATYEIHEDGQVDYSYNSAAKEPILTSTSRPLELNDIYFLFSSRVFQDKTPFTEGELLRFGVEEYNPYEIVRKTHGIMPIDRYWIKFSDEDLTYKKAADNFAEYFVPAQPPETLQEPSVEEESDTESNPTADEPENVTDEIVHEAIFSLDSILEQKSNEFSSINDVNSILNEGKLDVESLASNIDDVVITESAFATAQPQKAADDLQTSIVKEVKEETSGGNLSPEAIAALLASAGAE